MASPRESLEDCLLPSGKAVTAHSQPRSKPTNRCSTFKREYNTTCVTTKESFVILLWSAVLNAISFALVLYYISLLLTVSIRDATFSLLVYYMLGLLTYPLAGYVGDTLFSRFKILAAGSLVGLVGFISLFVIVPVVVLVSLSVFENFHWFYLPVLFLVPGMGLFQANVLQYGIDQLNFANSKVISSFVYWYYWTCYLFFATFTLANYLPLFTGIDLISLIVSACISFVAILICIATTIACCIGCCFWNRSLREDPGHQVNPVKLIWRVMNFVRKHKHPLCRSAFTYDEWPSRLDMAKQRYGGPFTTEEVEDVKSFWRILLLLASLVGFQLHDSTTYIAAIYLHFDFSYTLASTWTISALVIVVTIPIYQFLIRPCFPACTLRMITKMCLGLFLTIVSLALSTFYSWQLISSTCVCQNVTSWNITANYCDPNAPWAHDCSVQLLCPAVKEPANLFNPVPQLSIFRTESTPSFSWLAIPQALNGLSHVLVFLTSLEFIVAQAPCVFRGFIIGLWYAMQSIHLLVTIIGYQFCVVFLWEYYLAKTLAVFLSMVLFAIVACKYKYRQLNEDADINVQQQIEDIYERNFDREMEHDNELQKEEQQYAYHVVDSM